MRTPRGCLDGSAIPVDPPANVLLQAPSLGDASTAVCPTVGADGERNVLVVALSGNPGVRLDAWRRARSPPEEVGIITVDGRRSAASSGTSTVTSDPAGTTVSTTTISEPGDLTGIGIRIGECLSAWEDRDATTHVCFDSITTLLQYVDPRKAFRFLHVVTRRIAEVDGVAHFHFDPAAHDEQTVATIRSLFPAVYTFDDSDTWACE